MVHLRRINKWRVSSTKILIIALILTIVVFTLIWNIFILSMNDSVSKNKGLYCLNLSGNKLPELDESEPKLGSAIFFHETSCPEDMSDIFLNARQACSVESALRAHPYTDVFLLISSPVFIPLTKTKNYLIQHLLSYINFKLRHISFSKYLSDTPLIRIHSSGALNTSYWPVSHSSDVLRYATLFKFGGIYLDLDVIVLKPLMRLKNFAGAESKYSLASSILGFSYDPIGRKVAVECAEELARTYDGTLWGFNGPGVITRVLQKICNTTVISSMPEKHCGGFRVYPTEYFSALSFDEPQFFFENGNTKQAWKILNRSYVIHYWNKLSRNIPVDNQLDVPFLEYARKYCPGIFEVTNGNFNI